MLERPDLRDGEIVDVLKNEYALQVKEVVFLPLGADLNTAVYRAVAGDGTAYFVKLRRGDFDQASLTVPKYLHDLGLEQVIPAVTSRSGTLWANLDRYRLIVYPFVEGRHAFEVQLSDGQRVEFGRALRQFHSTGFPPAMTMDVRRETFSPLWRDTVRSYLGHIEGENSADPLAREAAAFFHSHRDRTLDLVDRAERLARALRARTPEFILCHGDIHGWNLLIDSSGALYLVDWDTLIFAPKERDLMFVGVGLGGRGHSPQDEENLFYQGYGQTQVNPQAVAYYRYERIVEDIAIFYEQIILSDRGGEDREQALLYLKANFSAGGTIDVAYQADRTLLFHPA
jgi:spectinomycin phosphotransferase